MADTHTPESFQQFLREHRGSEANFETILQQLNATIASAKNSEASLADGLDEVKEKYVPAYTKAKEVGGSAWPEFEKLISELEKVLVQRNNG